MKEAAIRTIRGKAKTSRTYGIKDVKSPLSYEGVFARVAPIIVGGYETVGKGVARAIGEGIDETVTSVETSVSNIISSFTSSSLG